MNDDRVSELYLGEAGFASKASHLPCRSRIDWMVSEVRGRTLDIGSSQGIVSILLGRAGHDVTGVEIEDPAITYARTALAAEPAAVQQRVRFVQADIYADVLAGQRFETVVLGEILEHHANPRALWLRAAELVAPGGKLVGTTPFGLHPHPDHKITFYMRLFVDTIAGVGTLTHLDIQDGFIRFVVRMDPKATAVDVGAAALLALSEQAFLSIQEEVEEVKLELRARNERIAALNERAKTLSQRLDQANAKLVSQREEHRSQNEALASARSLLETYTKPPDDATPRVRGFSAFLASLLREVNTGGLREAPLQALRKTYARVRRAAGRELSPGE